MLLPHAQDALVLVSNRQPELEPDPAPAVLKLGPCTWPPTVALPDIAADDSGRFLRLVTAFESQPHSESAVKQHQVEQSYDASAGHAYCNHESDVPGPRATIFTAGPAPAPSLHDVDGLSLALLQSFEPSGRDYPLEDDMNTLQLPGFNGQQRLEPYKQTLDIDKLRHWQRTGDFTLKGTMPRANVTSRAVTGHWAQAEWPSESSPFSVRPSARQGRALSSSWSFAPTEWVELSSIPPPAELLPAAQGGQLDPLASQRQWTPLVDQPAWNKRVQVEGRRDLGIIFISARLP